MIKHRFFAFLYVGLVAAGLPRILSANDYSGSAGFTFLTLPVGARATAMGRAFGSVPNDVQGLAYNPACLATMAASQLSFQHLNYVESVTQEAIAYGKARRMEGVSWGLSANYLRVGDITRTVATNNTTGDGFTEAGNFSTYDMALGVSAAAPVSENMKAGTTLKLIHESLADASASAGAVDVGLMYKLNDAHSWNIGVSGQNIGFATKFKDAAVKLPTSLRAGISGQPFAQWLFSTDYVKRVDTKGDINVGAEITPRRFFSLRAGYRYPMTNLDLGGLTNFSAGLGLRYRLLSFDYAFIPLGDLGITHHISFNMRFKPKDN